MDDEYFGFSSEPDLPEHVPENGEQQRKKADIDLAYIIHAKKEKVL